MTQINTNPILIDFEKVDHNGEIRKRFTQDQIYERLRYISLLRQFTHQAQSDAMRAFFKSDLYTPKCDVSRTAWQWQFEGENPMTMPISRWRDYALLGGNGCGKTTFAYAMAIKYALFYGCFPYYLKSRDITDKNNLKLGWLEKTKRAKFLIIDELGIADSSTEFREQNTRAIFSDILKSRLYFKNKYLSERKPNPITILISNFILEGERVAPVLEGTLGGVFTKLKFTSRNYRKIEMPDEKNSEKK